MDLAAKVTSKGQVTIPRAVRDKLGISEGDEIVFRVEEHGPRSPRHPTSSTSRAPSASQPRSGAPLGTRSAAAPGALVPRCGGDRVRRHQRPHPPSHR